MVEVAVGGGGRFLTAEALEGDRRPEQASQVLRGRLLAAWRGGGHRVSCLGGRFLRAPCCGRNAGRGVVQRLSHQPGAECRARKSARHRRAGRRRQIRLAPEYQRIRRRGLPKPGVRRCRRPKPEQQGSDSAMRPPRALEPAFCASLDAAQSAAMLATSNSQLSERWRHPSAWLFRDPQLSPSSRAFRTSTPSARPKPRCRPGARACAPRSRPRF